MNKTLIYILLTVICLQISAQEIAEKTSITKFQTEEIQTLFVGYFNEINNEPKNWNKILDFTYPELFSLTSKNDIIDQLKKSITNKIFNISFDKIELKEIKQSFRFNNVIYTKVLYKSIMTFHFKKSEDQKESEFNNYVNFMLSAYKNQFKKSDVTKKGNNITVNGNKTIITVHLKGLKKPCYMLEYLENNELYYSMFLPKEVAKYITANF